MYILDKKGSVTLAETRDAQDMPLVRKRETLPTQGFRRPDKSLKIGLCLYSEEATAFVQPASFFLFALSKSSFILLLFTFVLLLSSKVGWILTLKLFIICEIVHLTFSFSSNYKTFFFSALLRYS